MEAVVRLRRRLLDHAIPRERDGDGTRVGQQMIVHGCDGRRGQERASDRAERGDFGRFDGGEENGGGDFGSKGRIGNLADDAIYSLTPS